MSWDGNLTAVDLSALTGESAPMFTNCRKLTLVRLPAALKSIACRMFRGCMSLAAVDLSACWRLADIGGYSFSACFGLKRVVIPATVTYIGLYAFLVSGLKHLQAVGSRLVIEIGAFSGCTSLAEGALGSTRLCGVVFAGCRRLSVLTIERMEACDRIGLCGSNVSSVEGDVSQCAVDTSYEVLTAPSAVRFHAKWDLAHRGAIVPMTT
jgi:hypothetical protein